MIITVHNRRIVTLDGPADIGQPLITVKPVSFSFAWGLPLDIVPNIKMQETMLDYFVEQPQKSERPSSFLVDKDDLSLTFGFASMNNLADALVMGEDEEVLFAMAVGDDKTQQAPAALHILSRKDADSPFELTVRDLAMPVNIPTPQRDVLLIFAAEAEKHFAARRLISDTLQAILPKVL